MNRPLESGDICEVVGGQGQRQSPNLGLRVTIVHRVMGARGMDHSRFGAIYHCQGDGIKQLTDAGGYIQTNRADFAQSWLRRIDDVPPVTSKAMDVEHAE